MFHHNFQSGPYVEVLDAKIAKEKDKTMFRVNNPNINTRIYNKQLKTYVIELQGNQNKLSIPKEQKVDLYLIQQYLVLQLYIASSNNFSLQLIISDLNKTKRRIIFTHNITKPQRKSFFIKLSNQCFRKDKWINMCIDLHSFINAFKGQNYRSLDCIYITGTFKLRKIYTTKTPLNEAEGEDEHNQSKISSAFLPKHFGFPSGIAYANQIIDYWPYEEKDHKTELQIKNFNTETESNLSNHTKLKFQDTRKQFSTPKIQALRNHRVDKSVDQKRFLANTNSSQVIKKLRKNQQSVVKQKQNKSTIKPSDKQSTPVTKNPAGNAFLANTQASRLERTSLQKKTITIVKQPSNSKAKLEVTKINPWRNNKEQEYVHEEIQVEQPDQRDVKSAKTTLFKKQGKVQYKKLEDCKVYTNNKKVQSTIYSDTEYFELSQKFSTISDPKFFKPEMSRLSSKNIKQQMNTQQRRLQEQIQEELDGGSLQSSHRKTLGVQEAINMNKQQKISQQQSSCQLGFMEQHLRKMIDQIDRPYSPPVSNYEEHIQQVQTLHNPDSKEVELIYDPVLKCYFDFKTNTYYELKA